MADQAGGFGDVVVDDRVASLVDGVAGGVGGDEWIAIAVAADPGAEGDHLRQIRDGNFAVELSIQRAHDLFVNFGHAANEAGAVVIQSHFDFIADRGRTATNLIALPQRRDLGGDLPAHLLGALIGERGGVECFEQP